MSDYLTKFGSSGSGDGVNDDATLAVKFVHDIFLRAEREHLDVFMVCGTLRKSLRKRFFTSVTRHSFVDCVEDALRAGSDVSILVWSDQPSDYDVSDFKQLAVRARTYPGKLSLRASGTREGSEHVTHFIVAKRRDDSRWIVRVEKPHEEISETEVRQATFSVPAAVVFTSELAERHGRTLMKIFNRLFHAIPRPLAADAIDEARCIDGALI